MIGVFASFALANDPNEKLLAIGCSSAIFLDATVVRMLVVPATMALFDRKAWWLPRWLDRLLPNVDVEGAHLMEHLEHEPTAPAPGQPRSSSSANPSADQRRQPATFLPPKVAPCVALRGQVRVVCWPTFRSPTVRHACGDPAGRLFRQRVELHGRHPVGGPARDRRRVRWARSVESRFARARIATLRAASGVPVRGWGCAANVRCLGGPAHRRPGGAASNDRRRVASRRRSAASLRRVQAQLSSWASPMRMPSGPRT